MVKYFRGYFVKILCEIICILEQMKDKKQVPVSDKTDVESENENIEQLSFESENSDSNKKNVKKEKSDKKDNKGKKDKKSKEKTETTKDDESKIMNNDPDLKENVISYLQINNIIYEKKEELKELTKKKLKYEEFLKEYLERENKTKIETNEGDIVFKKQTSKMPLKEDIIEKAIVKKFQDTRKINESGVKIAHDILEEVNSLRGVNIKSNVRYIKKKGKK